MKLIPDQVAGVEWILKGLSTHKGVILADRVGFGKTAQAIEVLKKAVKKKPVLIIAPAYIVLNWLDELEKWGVNDLLCVIDSGKQIIGESKIYIGSYNMVSKEAIFKQLFKKEFSLIIADECFPAGTKIITDKGLFNIEDIINNTKKVKILSQNIKTGELEYKKIKRYLKNAFTGNLLCINYKHGNLLCTPNHKIYIEGKGYVTAEKIKPGNNIRIIQDWEEETGPAAMPRVWERIYNRMLEFETILWPYLCRNIPVKSARTSGKNEQPRNEKETIRGEQKSLPKEPQAGVRLVYTDEGKQPHAQSRNHRKSKSNKNKKRDMGQIPGKTRGQRFYNRTAEKIISAFRHWMGIRIPGQNRRKENLPYQLQSRYRKPGVKNSDRNRWAWPCRKTKTIRQEKRHKIITTRVESITVHKQRSITGHEKSKEKNYVYNLEIENNHNYFANGVLVSNCHYLKSWNSIRSRRILGTYQAKKTNLLNRTDYILGLTGTPILNRIDEIYNIIIRIAPEVLHHIKKIDFLHKFAAHVEYTPWGVQHRGVKNEHELREALKPVLLSRKKIKGLPPLVTHPVKMKIKGAELQAFIKEEERFLHAHGITETEIDTLQSVSKLDASQIAHVRQRVALFKIPVFIEALHNIFEKTEQAILYTYHKAPQEALYTEVKKKFPNKKIAVINGGVLNKKRFEIIKKYQAGEIDIIIATIGALKEGVNLTAGNYVLFLELSWTPADIEQAIARLHRKGQESTVFAYFFYFTSGIDRHLIRLIQDKRKVIDKVVGWPRGET